MMDHRLGALVLAVIALSAAPAAAQTASKCTAQKYKAVGRYAQELAGCRAKTLGKGLPPETLCAAKAALKLQKAFLKAERKGDCLGTRDLTFAAGETDGYVESLAPVLESKLFCCSFAGLSATACTWQPDPESCTIGLGGTLGADGSVCDGATGTCVAPPTDGGACCSFETIPCQGGDFSIGVCKINGGSFSENGVCVAAGTCEAP